MTKNQIIKKYIGGEQLREAISVAKSRYTRWGEDWTFRKALVGNLGEIAFQIDGEWVQKGKNLKTAAGKFQHIPWDADEKDGDGGVDFRVNGWKIDVKTHSHSYGFKFENETDWRADLYVIARSFGRLPADEKAADDVIKTKAKACIGLLGWGVSSELCLIANPPEPEKKPRYLDKAHLAPLNFRAWAFLLDQARPTDDAEAIEMLKDSWLYCREEREKSVA